MKSSTHPKQFDPNNNPEQAVEKVDTVQQENIVVSALKEIIFGNDEYRDDLVDIVVHTDKNKLLILTQESQDKKYHLRDQFFANVLKIAVENISGKYAFIIDLNDALENPVVANRVKKLQEIAQRAYVFNSRSGIFQTTTLSEGETPVGKVIINEPTSVNLSLARLDVFGEHKGRNHGNVLMDYVIDFCLKNCANLKIHVDKARSDKDDPLIFYTKFLKSRNIKFGMGSDYATMFFDCQTALSVGLPQILNAKFPGEYAKSGLTPPQFLAMKYFGLTTKQVQPKWFDRDCYLALQKGIAYEELHQLGPDKLELLLILDAKKIERCKTFDLHQLILLVNVNPALLDHDTVFDAIKKLDVKKLYPSNLKLFIRIIKEMNLQSFENDNLEKMIALVKSLTSIQIDALNKFEANHLLNEDAFILVKNTDEELLGVFNRETGLKPGYISFTEFNNRISRIRQSHITINDVTDYLTKITALLTQFQERISLPEECKQLMKAYKQDKLIPEYLYDDRKKLKEYYEKFTAFSQPTTVVSTSVRSIIQNADYFRLHRVKPFTKSLRSEQDEDYHRSTSPKKSNNSMDNLD